MRSASASPLRAAVLAAGVAALFVIVLIAAGAGAAVAALGGIANPGHTVRSELQPTAAGWPWGQCTWYVAIRRAQMAEPVTWGGNAWEWLANATAKGKPETSIPAPGEIVVYRRGGSYDPRYGHVALVIGFGPGSYTVSEANYYGVGVIDARSISWPDPQVAGFIA